MANVSFFLSIFFIGILVGSISNLCVVRWHDRQPFFKTGARCETCGHSLKWYERCAVFSYLFFKGKHSCCNDRIPLQNLFVEILTGLIFLVIYITKGFTAESMVLMFVSWMYIVATVSDVNYREIPDELVMIAAPVIVLLVALGINTYLDALFGLLPSISIVFLMLILSLFMGDGAMEGIGGGDIKFLIAVGGVMGIDFLIPMIFIASCMSVLIYGAYIVEDLITHNRTYIPMMVGFSSAFILMLLMHYTSSTSFDILTLFENMYFTKIS